MPRVRKVKNVYDQNQEFIDTAVLTSSKKPELVEKRRQQIVKGACQLFFKKGYHPTSVHEIARICGMSMGQLYHYISSKDDILYLVHKYMQQIWYGYLKNSHHEETNDPKERLQRALQQTLKFMIDNKKLIQFLYTESKYLDKKHLQTVLEMDRKNVINFFRQILDDMNKEKPLKCNRNFAASIITYLMVFLPLRGWTLKGMSIKQEMVCMNDFILKGLGLDSNNQGKVQNR